jgi:hypothetical protein
MLELSDLLKRVKARVIAWLPDQWRGDAGALFRDGLGAISEYSKNSVRIQERLQEAPNVIWETLKVKSSQALLNAAEVEQRRIETELARRTATAKARQEEATADKLEAEAEISKFQVFEARLTFIEKLRKLNVVPVWDEEGNMRFVKTPVAFDWDELTKRVVGADDLAPSDVEPKSKLVEKAKDEPAGSQEAINQ